MRIIILRRRRSTFFRVYKFLLTNNFASQRMKLKKILHILEFFDQLDKTLGPLTPGSSLNHLVRYVQAGIKKMKWKQNVWHMLHFFISAVRYTFLKLLLSRQRTLWCCWNLGIRPLKNVFIQFLITIRNIIQHMIHVNRDSIIPKWSCGLTFHFLFLIIWVATRTD